MENYIIYRYTINSNPCRYRLFRSDKFIQNLVIKIPRNSEIIIFFCFKEIWWLSLIVIMVLSIRSTSCSIYYSLHATNTLNNNYYIVRPVVNIIICISSLSSAAAQQSHSVIKCRHEHKYNDYRPTLRNIFFFMPFIPPTVVVIISILKRLMDNINKKIIITRRVCFF